MQAGWLKMGLDERASKAFSQGQTDYGRIVKGRTAAVVEMLIPAEVRPLHRRPPDYASQVQMSIA